VVNLDENSLKARTIFSNGSFKKTTVFLIHQFNYFFKIILLSILAWDGGLKIGGKEGKDRTKVNKGRKEQHSRG